VSFVARLVTGMVAVLLATVLVLGWSADALLRQRLEGDIRSALERDARLVEQALPADTAAYQATVHRLSGVTGLRITLIDSAGRVRAESELAGDSLNRIENHFNRPEVQQALQNGVGADRRLSRTVGRPLMYVALRSPIGFVRVATGLEQVDAIVSRAQRAVLVASLVALLLGLLVALPVARSFAQPLTELSASARAIAAGEPPRFPHAGVPDIDALVAALREMHEELDRRFAELRREQAESATLVEAMIEGVLATDARGRIVTANAAARRLLGYSGEQAMPDLRQLFHPKPARAAVDAVLSGESVVDQELELDGSTVLANARPLPSGGAVLVLHDVTDLRRLETMRRDFVANVSHELKTPLTSIAGYAETLVGETPDAPTTRRFLEVILVNARRMQRLVDDLLDLSRIESGGWLPAPESVDVADTAAEVLEAFADRAHAVGVTLQVEVPPDAPALIADPQAVRQILTNLVDNALRYTPRGGRVSVAARHEQHDTIIEIRDTGSGIPAEHLPRLFERFYRVDPSRSRAEGGTGLGLAIVKHLVEAHGGICTAESNLGQRTNIRIRIPDPSPEDPPV